MVADQIRSDQILPTGSVTDVHKETRVERFFRTSGPIFRSLTAFLFLTALVAVSIYILVSHDEYLKDFRTPAWGLLAGVAGACSTLLFGDHSKKP